MTTTPRSIRAEDIVELHIHKGCLQSCPCKHAVSIRVKDQGSSPIPLGTLSGDVLIRLMTIVKTRKVGVKFSHFAPLFDMVVWDSEIQEKHRNREPIQCSTGVTILYPQNHYWANGIQKPSLSNPAVSESWRFSRFQG